MTHASRSLFDAPVTARHDGPETSQRMAQRLSKSEYLRTQRERVMAALIQNPGSTSAELGELSGVDRHNAARRLREMELRGLVVKSGTKRLCRCCRKQCVTWNPMTAADIAAADESAASPKPTMTDHAPMTDDQLIAWFHENRAQLPTEPFDLRPGEHVSNPERFYASLEADITAGPHGEFFWRSVSNARWSPLLGDIADLKAIVDRSTRPAADPQPQALDR